MKWMIVPVLFASVTAMADFNLCANGKKVVCYGPDNQSWILNASRTAIKFTVEGESKGPMKITKTDTDGDTFVSYQTAEGLLSLDDQGDTYQFIDEDESYSVKCH